MNAAIPERIGANSKLELRHEFYWLRDSRANNQLMSMKGRYDDDPVRTTRLAQQYEARIKSRYPDWVLGDWNPDCGGVDRREGIRLQDAELSPIVAFKRPAPKRIYHYDKVRVLGFDLCLGGCGDETFNCVSLDWKNAIESLEPGIHEFHPLRLKFKDGVEFDRFIFRPMQLSEVVDLSASDCSMALGRPELTSDSRHVVLFRKAVEGKHWVMDRRPYHSAIHPFVSARLAGLLRRLLPPGVQLQAVQPI
jgi:hypothetical protein